MVNVSGTYDLPRNWSIGAKLSAVGGAPFTPYDADKSSLVEAWDAQGRPYYDYARYNAERLDAFAQLDLRIDKIFYFKGCMLGFYIDLQNVTVSKLRQPDVLMSTGEILNPEAPVSEQRYRMKSLRQESGTLLPLDRHHGGVLTRPAAGVSGGLQALCAARSGTLCVCADARPEQA